MCGIYKITNQINGHSYIGQSVDIKQRFRRHKDYKFYDSNWENKILYKAFEKYGLDNFSFEVIEECKQSLLNEREQYWIDYYNTFYDGYNATMGGDGSLNITVKLTEDQVFEIYDLLKNTNISQNDIASKYNVGKDVISTINHGKSRWHPNISYPLRKNKNDIFYCPDCGRQVTQKGRRCIECAHKKQYVTEHPDRETLKNLIRNSNFAAIGRKYGVTDNTIRKWCIKVGLPSKAKEINLISDVDWEKI